MVYAMYQGFVNVPVALYQYVTPVILAVTMVRWNVMYSCHTECK